MTSVMDWYSGTKRKHPLISGCFLFSRYGCIALSARVCQTDVGLGGRTKNRGDYPLDS